MLPIQAQIDSFTMWTLPGRENLYSNWSGKFVFNGWRRFLGKKGARATKEMPLDDALKYCEPVCADRTMFPTGGVPMRVFGIGDGVFLASYHQEFSEFKNIKSCDGCACNGCSFSENG